MKLICALVCFGFVLGQVAGLRVNSPVASKSTSDLRVSVSEDPSFSLSGDDIHTLLWDGIDLPPDIDDERDMLKHVKPGSNTTIAKVLGMFDTGNHLMGRMLKRNFPNRTRNWPEGTTFDKTDPGESLWTHTPPVSHGDFADRVERTLKQIKKSNGIAILMVRDPITQMQSWKKAPYKLAPCISKLQRPCKMTWWAPGASRPDAHAFPAPGLAGVWNEVTAGYVRLHQQYPNTILVRYEDLVLNPQAVMERVGAALHMDVPSPVRVLEEASKTHGDPRPRDAAVQHILDMDAALTDPWLQGHLSLFCSELFLQLDDEIPNLGSPKYGCRC